MRYHFRAVERFWICFYRLSSADKALAREAWQIFKEDPFDSHLGTHKIQSLSAYYGRTIYSVRIGEDLRSTFYVDGNTVVSLTIGTHKIYKA